MNLNNILELAKEWIKEDSEGNGYLNKIASATGIAANTLIGNGYQSTPGAVFSTLSPIASAIPGIGGAAASLGLGILGGLSNRAFGTKLNQDNIARVQANINELNDFLSGATDYDSLALEWSNAPAAMTFGTGYIGKNGWFNHGASNLAKSLKNLLLSGTTRVQNTLMASANNLEATLMRGLQSAYINAFGGDLMTHGANFDTGLTVVDNGGTHEENPYEGVPMGMDSEGVPNLVEEGEVIFNDYVFSKRLKVPKKQGKELLGLKGDLTFADAAKRLSKESEERPNDPISKDGLNDSMTKLTVLQEMVRAEKEMKDNNKNKLFAKGGKLGRKYDEGGPFDQTLKIDSQDYIGNLLSKPLYTVPKRDTLYDTILDILNNQPIELPPINVPNTVQMFGREYNLPQAKALTLRRRTYTDIIPEPTWMRKVPIYASGIMSLTDALGFTNKPDYSDAQMALSAAREPGRYMPVSFDPISTMMPEQSIDRRYYLNRIDQNIAATRRNILNTSSGNRAAAVAGLLAANAAGISKTGDILNNIEEQNFQDKLKIREFNRGTESTNSSGKLQAATANQKALADAKSAYLSGVLNAALIRQNERQAATAARSANLSNFINSLGDLGRENFSRNMIAFDPSKYYTMDDRGVITYKPQYSLLPASERAIVDSIVGIHQDLAQRVRTNG